MLPAMFTWDDTVFSLGVFIFNHICILFYVYFTCNQDKCSLNKGIKEALNVGWGDESHGDPGSEHLMGVLAPDS